MTKLSPIFSQHALTGAVNDASAETGAMTGSDTAQDTLMSLEYKPNPFKQLMKQIDTLLETDPKEALRLIVKHLREDKSFTKAYEISKLEGRLPLALERTFDQRRLLGEAFTIGSLNLQPALTAAATPAAHMTVGSPAAAAPAAPAASF